MSAEKPELDDVWEKYLGKSKANINELFEVKDD